jgi:CRISPR-associated protein Csm4
MKLIRYRLRTGGSWLTPWRADTLGAMLAAQLAADRGADALRRELIDPWQLTTPAPPFVLSDAFPGDFLPKPESLGFLITDPAERKHLKDFHWLTRDQFAKVQRGQKPALGDPPHPIAPFVRLRNVLDRTSGTTGGPGGAATLYATAAECLAAGLDYLTVYARVTEAGEALLSDLLELLSHRGFGADAGIGHGQFTVEKPEAEEGLEPVEGAAGWISLSTFQPAPADPVAGYWRSFPKYGKLGPDVGADNVFKRPQWMVEPGACFFAPSPKPWYGRAIPAADLLPDRTLRQLEPGGIRPVQPAFAVAVPATWIGPPVE